MMGLPKAKSKYTVAEYLKMERAVEERHIYVDGELFAMVGESDAHGEISMNLAGIFYAQLKGKHCRARTKDTKVRSGPMLKTSLSHSGMFSYPDIVVVCGEREYHDEYKDVLLNPTAIVEVLSTTTEAFDRGPKFHRFQTWNPTLKDYVLVAQDQPLVEHFSRKSGDVWSYRRYTDLKASFRIRSIGCTLKLADIYDRITFPKSK